MTIAAELIRMLRAGRALPNDNLLAGMPLAELDYIEDQEDNNEQAALVVVVCTVEVVFILGVVVGFFIEGYHIG